MLSQLIVEHLGSRLKSGCWQDCQPHKGTGR